jgi:hypothetical protein
MNSLPPTLSKKNRSLRHIPACKKAAHLLKTKTETARAPLRGRKEGAFTSLFERWFLSTDSQAGDFLLWLVGGSRGPSGCGTVVSEPQDAGTDKILEMKRLEKVA